MRGGPERVGKIVMADASLFGDSGQTFAAPQGFFKGNRGGASVAKGFVSRGERSAAVKASRRKKEVEKARKHCYILLPLKV